MIALKSGFVGNFSKTNENGSIYKFRSFFLQEFLAYQKRLILFFEQKQPPEGFYEKECS